MAQVQVQIAAIYEGPAYYENTEDGQIEVYDCFAGVTTADGKDFRHYLPFRSRRDYRLEELVARIEAAGAIDTDHWVELEAPTSLEERWALIAQQEDEVRRGFRSEEDLYHGVPVR